MKILFYVNNIGPPDKADYQHCIIALAEGFKALNIDFDSNIDYYKINNTDEYLFKKKENFTIPELFIEKFNLFQKLEKNNTLNFDNYINYNFDNYNGKFKSLF